MSNEFKIKHGLIVNGDISVDNNVSATTFVGELDGSISSDTTAVTQTSGDNSTKVATTAYVDSAVSTEDLWDRTGTDLSPKTAGDSIKDVSDITLSNSASILSTSPYSITAPEANGTYDWVGFTQQTTLTISHDGTKIFTNRDNVARIKSATLSTPWDVTTAGSQTSDDLIGTGTKIRTVRFNNDGTKMYVGEQSTRIITEFSLSTPYLVSSNTLVDTFNASSQASSLDSIEFSSDGSKFYVIGFNPAIIHQYSLGTNWDVSTATYDSKSFSLASQESSLMDTAFSSDGTKFFAIGLQHDSVFKYSLSTAWDISTMSYTGDSFYTGYNYGAGVAFNDDGTVMYTHDFNGYTDQYNLKEEVFSADSSGVTSTGVFTGDGSGLTNIYDRALQTTGLLYGGEITTVPAPVALTLDWTAGAGVVTDFTDPRSPVVTKVSWDEVTGYSPVNIGTPGTYGIAYNAAGEIVEYVGDTFTPEIARQYITIGAYISINNFIIRVSNNAIALAYDNFGALKDLMRDVIGPANISGNVISANGANLSLNNSGGDIFGLGYNIRNSYINPNIFTVPSGSVISFTRLLRSSGGSTTSDGSGFVSVIDPTKWDDGSGTLQTITGTKYSVQVVYILPDGTYAVAYGQELFNQASAAQSAVLDGTLSYEERSTLLKLVRRAFIVVGNTETDLTNAVFIQDGKFRIGGLSTGGGGTVSHATLNDLEWNIAGHTFDGVGTMDIGGYNFTTTGAISGTLADGVVATTQADGDNSTKVATTSYVDNHTSNGVWTRTGVDVAPTNSGDTVSIDTYLLIDSIPGVHPYVHMKHESESILSILGTCYGQDLAPDGTGYTNAVEDALLLGTQTGQPLILGTNSTSRFFISSAGVIDAYGDFKVSDELTLNRFVVDGVGDKLSSPDGVNYLELTNSLFKVDMADNSTVLDMTGSSTTISSPDITLNAPSLIANDGTNDRFKVDATDIILYSPDTTNSLSVNNTRTDVSGDLRVDGTITYNGDLKYYLSSGQLDEKWWDIQNSVDNKIIFRTVTDDTLAEFKFLEITTDETSHLVDNTTLRGQTVEVVSSDAVDKRLTISDLGLGYNDAIVDRFLINSTISRLTSPNGTNKVHVDDVEFKFNDGTDDRILINEFTSEFYDTSGYGVMAGYGTVGLYDDTQPRIGVSSSTTTCSNPSGNVTFESSNTSTTIKDEQTVDPATIELTNGVISMFNCDAKYNFREIDSLASTEYNIFDASDLTSLATSGTIIVSDDLTVNIKNDVASTVNYTMNGGNLKINIQDNATYTYPSSGTFISGSGNIKIQDGMLYTTSGTCFDIENTVSTSGVFELDNTQLYGWSLGTIDRADILISNGSAILGYTDSLYVKNMSVFKVTDFSYQQWVSTNKPMFSIESSYTPATILGQINNATGTILSGESLLRIEPCINDNAEFSINQVGVSNSGTLFDLTSTSGTFTAVADASIAFGLISGVSDNNGVARFASTDTVYVGQKIDIEHTHENYDGINIVSSTDGSTWFECNGVDFVSGQTAGGLFTSDSVTLTESGTTASEGDTILLDTDLATTYDVGSSVYNVTTNTFQVNAVYNGTATGSWNNGSLNQNSKYVEVVNCGSHANSVSNASIYVSGNVATTTTTGSGTWDALNVSSFSEGQSISRFKLVDSSTGELEYTGINPYSGGVACAISAFKSAASAVDHKFRLYKTNGTGAFDAIEPTRSLTDNLGSVSLVSSITMNPGDRFRVEIASQGASTTVTIQDLSLTTG